MHEFNHNSLALHGQLRLELERVHEGSEHQEGFKETKTQ